MVRGFLKLCCCTVEKLDSLADLWPETILGKCGRDWQRYVDEGARARVFAHELNRVAAGYVRFFV